MARVREVLLGYKAFNPTNQREPCHGAPPKGLVHMIVECPECLLIYNDAARWTICPHPKLDEPPPRKDGTMSEAMAAMPQYKCHKIVSALKILSVTPDGSPPRGADESCIITPDHPAFAPFRVDSEYCRRHNPKAGGYYVVYPGGYTSYSPAEAFESGYTRI